MTLALPMTVEDRAVSPVIFFRVVWPGRGSEPYERIAPNGFLISTMAPVLAALPWFQREVGPGRFIPACTCVPNTIENMVANQTWEFLLSRRLCVTHLIEKQARDASFMVSIAERLQVQQYVLNGILQRSLDRVFG